MLLLQSPMLGSRCAALPSSSFLAPLPSAKRQVATPRRQQRTQRDMAIRADDNPILQFILGEGGASKIKKVSPVGGGCINNASRYDTDAGSFFVKTNSDVGVSMFTAEAKGLEAMHETKSIRVPRPLKYGAMPRRGSYIIMENIDFGASRGSQAALGEQLARMHLNGTAEQFGFEMENTIGSTPQRNTWTPDWPSFFRDHRLLFQLDLIRKDYGDGELYQKGLKLLDRLPELLNDVSKPCLLHGDLWSGNIGTDSSGSPVIFDPACYYGSNEAEFGMSWCANFGQAFYDAYFSVIPMEPGFEERVELYKLYHYLNHYNLFGSSYRGSCTNIINRFI